MAFHCPSFDRLTDLAQLGQGGAQQFEVFGPATSPLPGKLLLTSPNAAMTADHQYRAALPAVSVYALPGHVLGSAGLLLQNDSVFWRGDVLPNYFRDVFQLGAVTPESWLHGMRLPDVETLHFDEPLAVATHPNAIYSHFLLEMLPRLYLLSLLRELGQPFRLALSTQTPAWMELFVALYFAPHEIVRYDSARQLVRAPAFILPAMFNVDYYLHPAVNLVFADAIAQMRAQTPPVRQPAGSLVYLSRRGDQDGSRGSMANAEVVEATLAEFGFAIVNPESLSVREQVEVYANATCLVSESGPGTHGVLFAPRGCKVVVINPLDRMEGRIAALRGHSLALIEPVGGFRSDVAAISEQSLPYSIDPEMLRRVLDIAMEKLEPAAASAYLLPKTEPSAPDPAMQLPSIAPASSNHGTTMQLSEKKGLSMFEQAKAIVDEAERIAEHGSAVDVIHQLRKLCLSDFSDLLAVLPQPHLPNISARLPRMASAEVQQSWTGGSGSGMFQATLDFVRIIEHHYTAVCQRPLMHAKILDYGCGYGRLMRPFYYFTNPDRIFGIDPWDKSIEVCVQDGVLGQLRQSEFLPTNLPVDDEKFDLIYSFSVFTHTSLHATTAALNALRKCISSSGVLVLTTRPLEYWSLPSHEDRGGFDFAAVTLSHKTTGFCHFPSNWNLPADGISIFGDTSFTPEWCMRSFPSWDVRAYDRGLDPMQMILLLTPR